MVEALDAIGLDILHAVIVGNVTTLEPTMIKNAGQIVENPPRDGKS